MKTMITKYGIKKTYRNIDGQTKEVYKVYDINKDQRYHDNDITFLFDVEFFYTIELAEKAIKDWRNDTLCKYEKILEFGHE